MWCSTSQKVKQLGGAVVDSHKEATHLVMSQAVRTIKLLCCLSTCKYILSEAWIRDSHAHNTFLGKILEFKMVFAKCVVWCVYGLNCCCCQWSYPVFWILTDLIFFPPLYGFRMQWSFQRMCFYWCRMSRQALGCTHPPTQWDLGAVSPGLKSITHIHVEQRLRLSGAVSPLPHMPAWCDFTFSLLLPNMIRNYWIVCYME